MYNRKVNNLQKALASWEKKSLYFIRMYSTLKNDISYSVKLWSSEFNYGRIWYRYAKCGISHKESKVHQNDIEMNKYFVIVISFSLIS